MRREVGKAVGGVLGNPSEKQTRVGQADEDCFPSTTLINSIKCDMKSFYNPNKFN